MNCLKMFGVIVIVTAGAIIAGAATPAWATSDRATKLAAPHWLDETVYRPNYPSNETDRCWPPGGFCDK